jgi:hypothetical protein
MLLTLAQLTFYTNRNIMAITLDGTAGINTSSSLTTGTGAIYNGIQSSTAVASTSGTSIDFTSIPSWVKRITVMLSGVSTNGTSNPIIQIGAGSVTTSGYTSMVQYSSTQTAFTTGFGLCNSISAATLVSGSVTISLLTSNTWVESGNVITASNVVFVSGGSIALGGTLDRVRITTVNGTDTFDAGSINILYE